MAKEISKVATIGFESVLWRAAALHSNVVEAQCKHVVAGIIFLKYISDTFEDLGYGKK